MERSQVPCTAQPTSKGLLHLSSAGSQLFPIPCLPRLLAWPSRAVAFPVCHPLNALIGLSASLSRMPGHAESQVLLRSPSGPSLLVPEYPPHTRHSRFYLHARFSRATRELHFSFIYAFLGSPSTGQGPVGFRRSGPKSRLIALLTPQHTLPPDCSRRV